MKIDEAQRILGICIETPKAKDGSITSSAITSALKLGIEALKRLQQLRLSPMKWFSEPLPGETEQ